MNTHIRIFKCNLLKCIDDCISILGDFKSDKDAENLIAELQVAKTIVDPMGEGGIAEVLLQFISAISGIREELKNRNVALFEDIHLCERCVKKTGICVCKVACHDKCVCTDSCLNCNEFLSSMDLKTFKGIKRIIKQGNAEDTAIMFDYVDCFIASGDQYKKSIKEKQN